MNTQRMLHSVAALTALAVLVAVPACRVAHSRVTVETPTEHASELLCVVQVDGEPAPSGMRVETIDGDTVVTRFEAGTRRRFVLKDRTGYRGQVLLDSVDLVVDGAELRIDGERLRLRDGNRNVEVLLQDDQGADRFDGQDLVIDGDGTVTTRRI